MLPSRQASFEAMVRAYSADLYRFAYWLCRDRASAQDLVQETYRRAWEHWASLQSEKAAKAWLLTILRRETSRMFGRRQVETVEFTEDEIGVSPSYDPTEALDMRHALERLPTQYREPLLLHVLFGLSSVEIARIMSLPEGGVLTRLYRARRALRRMIDPSLPKSPRRVVR